MTALKVFTESLRFLKDDALKTISASTAGMEFLASDFTWVLTVPAIWNPSAKQFMREAATEVRSRSLEISEVLNCSEEWELPFLFQAGIVTEGNEHKLVIALEPEAASVWCKKLPADGFITQNHDRDALDESPGTQYIVVDCGGKVLNTGLACLCRFFVI